MKIRRADSVPECRAMIDNILKGNHEGNFFEGMGCKGGCVGGPSNLKQETTFKKDRDALIGKADERGVWENLKNYDMESFSMHRTHEKQ